MDKNASGKMEFEEFQTWIVQKFAEADAMAQRKANTSSKRRSGGGRRR